MMKFMGIQVTRGWAVVIHTLESILLGVVVAVMTALLGYLSNHQPGDFLNWQELLSVAGYAAIGAFARGYPALIPAVQAVEAEVNSPPQPSPTSPIPLAPPMQQPPPVPASAVSSLPTQPYPAVQGQYPPQLPIQGQFGQPTRPPQ